MQWLQRAKNTPADDALDVHNVVCVCSTIGQVDGALLANRESVATPRA